MSMPPDELERKECLAFVDQIFSESAESHASEILFRTETGRVQTFFLIDGKYEKRLTIPLAFWKQMRRLLESEYFDSGQYHLTYQGVLCIYEWVESDNGLVRVRITRKAVPGRRRDRIEDIFSAFEDPSWDSVKSIFLSILNLALEQGFNEIIMDLDGQVVDVGYFKDSHPKTNMTISSDSYDALTRLIGENYLAFGFMTREFREKEFLVRLKELNEDEVAPRIRLEIEPLP